MAETEPVGGGRDRWAPADLALLRELGYIAD